MQRNFFLLAWREAVRSAYWGKNLATGIGLGLLGLYFAANFLFLGYLIPKVFAEKFPNDDPVSKFNSFVLAYLAIDFTVRQFAQKLPTISFKPLLLLPVNRHSIAHYLIVRSLFSLFNLFPFLLLAPGVIGMVANVYQGVATTAWVLALAALVFGNHFLALYVKWRFNETGRAFFVILGVLASLFALSYFGIVDFSGALGALLNRVLAFPALTFAVLAIPVLTYFLNIKYLENKMFLDLLSANKKEQNVGNYNWLDRLGETGRFVALDLKLIWRNKRPRSTVVLLLFSMLYGLLVYKEPMGKALPDFIAILAGIIIVGMFCVSYGQFFPAWHSNYFSMLMCNRFIFKKLLRSFYAFVTVISVSTYIISLPYALIRPEIVYTHLAVMLYTIGVNIPFVFWIGLYSKKRLDLSQSSMMNYQGVSASQWIAAMPLVFVPMLLFYLFKLAFGSFGGFVGLGMLGLIGILGNQFIINFFAKQYEKNKYRFINNYKNS